jgi:actin related protein 2/3 complex, subunit 3
MSHFLNIANMAVLPLKTQFRGPAPKGDADKPDIIDEAISAYFAGKGLKSYDIKVRISLFFNDFYLIFLMRL